jgi:hypothetical protein
MVTLRLRESPVKPLMQQVHFANNDVDFSIVDYLIDQDLKDPAFTWLGHRRKILRAIAELDHPESNGRAPNRRVGRRAAIDKPLSGSNLDT